MRKTCGQLIKTDQSNIFFYHVKCKDGPTSGGTFIYKINVPPGFPMYPPKVSLVTKVFHPNVGDNGHVCTPWLCVNWVPMSIEKLCAKLQRLIENPVLRRCANVRAQHLYQTQAHVYNGVFKEYTQKYAG